MDIRAALPWTLASFLIAGPAVGSANAQCTDSIVPSSQTPSSIPREPLAFLSIIGCRNCPNLICISTVAEASRAL